LEDRVCGSIGRDGSIRKTLGGDRCNYNGGLAYFGEVRGTFEEKGGEGGKIAGLKRKYDITLEKGKKGNACASHVVKPCYPKKGGNYGQSGGKGGCDG